MDSLNILGLDWQELTGWAFAAYTIGEWVIRVVMLVVVPRRRSPTAAKGWLLLLFFLPWVGLIFFFLLGRRTLPRRYRDYHERLRTHLGEIARRFRGHPLVVRPDPGPVLEGSVRLAEHLGEMPILGGNAAEFLSDYRGIIDRLVADIDAARHHVHLLYYIFADDATGRRVAAALARAAKRGVTCRVLADALGSRGYLGRLPAALARDGVAFHTVLPLALARLRLDLRNHRKIAVIDGRVGYVGSQNLVDAVFKKGIEYDEMVVRVRGPAVLELQAVFLGDWYATADDLPGEPDIFPEPEQAGTAPAQVLPSGPVYEVENNQRLIVSLIHGARERVVLTTPYFVPDEPFLQAIQTAASRGVDVRLIVSRLADQLLVGLAQRSYYEELIEAGVHVHRYTPKFLHAKHLSVDDSVVLIGSSNMDIRSFELNAEISLLFYDREVARALRRHEDRFLADSEELDLEAWRQRGFVGQVLENGARLLSPLL